MVIVDTSVWIPALRRGADRVAPERLSALLEQGVVAVVPPVKLELLGGTKTEAEYGRLKSRLDALRQVEVTVDTWERAAQLAFGLRRKGVRVPYIDLIIAAAAIEEDAVLLHSDADFELISRHSELRAESLAVV